jgi:hypothetical protein
MRTFAAMTQRSLPGMRSHGAKANPAIALHGIRDRHTAHLTVCNAAALQFGNTVEAAINTVAQESLEFHYDVIIHISKM